MQFKWLKDGFPIQKELHWYNWLMAFRETLPSDDIWAKIDSFDITIIKGGIQTCNMVGYGSPSDTSGVTCYSTKQLKLINGFGVR